MWWVAALVILDLFAGPGGWDEGALSLGVDDVLGLENDDAACRTRYAAGHKTWQTDVTTVNPSIFQGQVDGLIASPPCQDFSAAGKKKGITGTRGQLVYEVMRWANVLLPDWIACEQVPPVLAVWRLFQDELATLGYSTWSGILNAADYAVPQSRKRAILIASRVGTAAPPEPTHAEGGTDAGMFTTERLPWITMAEALGWGASARPSPTLHAGKTGDGRVYGSDTHGSAVALLSEREAGRWVQRERSGDRSEEGFDPHAELCQAITSKARSWTIHEAWAWERPATTVVGQFQPDVIAAPGYRGYGEESRQNAEGSVRVTTSEAAVLQGFRPDYPWQGSRTKQFEQIGNAVPPPLAASILEALWRLNP